MSKTKDALVEVTMERIGDDSVMAMDTPEPEPNPEPDPEPETKPDPKPGDPDYDWSTVYGSDDLFTHTFKDGTVIALWAFDKIFSKTWLTQVSELQTDIDIEIAAIRRATCPAAWAIIMGLKNPVGSDYDPVDELWKAWSQGVTEGLTSGN